MKVRITRLVDGSYRLALFYRGASYMTFFRSRPEALGAISDRAAALAGVVSRARAA